MQKLNRILLVPDANNGGNPSSPPDANGAAPSPAEPTQQDPEPEPEPGNEPDPEPEPEPGGEPEPSPVLEPEPEPEPVVPLDKPEDASLEFHKHSRFQELVGEKNKAKQEVEQYKPLAEQARITNEFLRENQITAQEYKSALEYLRALRVDPVAAYAMLKPTYEQLALMSGDRLPADLQAEVAAGSLAPERATEIAKARSMQDYTKWQGQNRQQQQQVQGAEVVNGTIQSWASTKQSIDPDFKPGSPLWEQVDLRIRTMPQFQNAQEAQAGSEKAYSEAKAFMSKLVPRTVTPVKRPMQSRNSSSNNQTVMKTPEDVMNAIKNGVRPSQMRYS